MRSAARPSKPNADAPRGPCVHRLVSHDADEQAGNLRGWRQVYDQLSAGRFVGTLAEIDFDDVQLFRETTSQTLRQSCEVPVDACWFGIPLLRDGAGRIQSRAIDENALAVRPGGVEFELLTPSGYEILGVVATHDALRRHAEDVEHIDLECATSRGEIVVVGAGERARLAASLMTMLRSEITPTESMRSSLLSWLFECGALQCGEPAALPVASRRHAIATQARHYVLENHDRAVNVPELCTHLHVSRRTLQYCFQEAFGMAPNVYLRAIRLNGARRQLRHAGAAQKTQTVQDAAAAWGFWHLSQFALDYRKLFGMRPSETLNTATARAHGFATIDR
ncbi:MULTISPECIES: helix-turn-helix domain-containing protein [unclassified Caballeronia]|uniref:helix-turn-helix domain-containing protein n=1 Tax=unclassified Caballeronia TaxID=2646786 RepID=UPI002859F9F1|nr:MULTISPECIES: helix-turn-helix domain-containing protein [unclassified Caballeronia]MDR5774192.1 helix-turn-helix domain-containing protein [Caballeronia sp. LZ002]MDR5849627.1 helix-turn-helix domain-containing protein [Caballeronia sp. LZ003]